MQPRIERLIQQLRGTPLYTQLIPPGAGYAWPIPLRDGGRVYAAVPFFGFQRKAGSRETFLFPPFATITLDWESGVPVEYVHLRYRKPWPEERWKQPAGVFPHPAVARLMPDQYRARRTELLAMYDEMFGMLAAGSVFPAEWTGRFSALFALLIEPGLEPYLRTLGPKFVARFLPRQEPAAAVAGE